MKDKHEKQITKEKDGIAELMKTNESLRAKNIEELIILKKSNE
jgi:hypothetical protein